MLVLRCVVFIVIFKFYVLIFVSNSFVFETMTNNKGKRTGASQKSKRRDAIRMLMGVLPSLADSDSEEEHQDSKSQKNKGKQTRHDTKGQSHTSVNDLLGNQGPTRSHPSAAVPKDIPDMPKLSSGARTEDNSMDEWRRNNPCFLDMHVGHAARDHRLSHKEWDGPLGERWHKNCEAWNAVRNLAPFKTPEEIAATFKVDISKWKPTSNIELLIDVAETMANETRLWDGTPTTEPPAPKNHKWPDNMRPVLRSSGPASTKGGTVQASETMVFSSSPTQKTRKLKKSQKRKFLVSLEISRSVPSEAKALPPGKPNEVSKDENATRDATNALEDTSRCLFREKDALAETVDKHGQEIHNIHNTLWNVHAQIANLRLDNARSETLSRILLENAGIPEQLITQRLAAANSAAPAQIESQRLQSTRLQLTGATTTENVSNGKNGDEGEGSCKMEEDTAQDEPPDVGPLSRITIATLAKALSEA